MKDSTNAGPLATILSFVFGFVLNFDKATQDDITFWLQSLAFVVTVIAGVFTIYQKYLRCKAIKHEAYGKQEDSTDD